MKTCEAANIVDVQRRVNLLQRGEEGAEEWLIAFQNAAGSWKVCLDALRSGPRADVEGTMLQVFCAQTVAVVARALPGRCPTEDQQSFRDNLKLLLTLHVPPHGRTAVWRQLVLALTCAELWLGIWSPNAVIFAKDLPVAVCLEMLALPPELLFCERALPLNDLGLWQAATQSILDSCPAVFPYIFGCTDGAKELSDIGNALSLLAKWLRAARMSFEWGPPHEESEPLLHLSSHIEQLVAAAAQAPAEACEVAQQLARWKKCDNELSSILQALLSCLFNAAPNHSMQESIVPLLADLACDRWPRAALGDLDLDWRAIACQATRVLHAALSQREATLTDAEAALSIWQQFAMTVQDGTREWFDDQVTRPSGGGPHSEWYLPYESYSQADCLPQLFSLFCEQILVLLRVPAQPSIEDLRLLWSVRESAKTVLASWINLIGKSPKWQEVTWSPLRFALQLLRKGQETDAHQVEVLLWLSANLAATWPSEVGPIPTVSSAHEFDLVDSCTGPLRPLLWSAASGLVAHVALEECPRAIEWMLHRPPASAGSLLLLQFSELPYAKALEFACRRLPKGPAHVKVAERVLAVALAEVPAPALHSKSGEVRRLLLSAMCHVMGEDTDLLCRGLRHQVLPVLRQAAEADAVAIAPRGGHACHGYQTLFGTLAAVLPQNGIPIIESTHPVVLLFKEQWAFIQDAMLHVFPSSSHDQPLASATDLLSSAIVTLPVLLPEALNLLSQSAAKHTMPDLQLNAFCDVLLKFPCPPIEPSHAAELLSRAVFGVVEMLIARDEPLKNPQTMSKMFKMIGTAISRAPSLCNGLLRPQILSRVALIRSCVKLYIDALPNTSMPDVIENMLRFVVRLFNKGEILELPALCELIISLLPELCAAICCALATQEHFSSWGGLVNAGDFFCLASDCFPGEMGVALDFGLQHAVGISDWSCSQLTQHVNEHAGWPSRTAWLSGLQLIIQQWQCERRQTNQKMLTSN